MGPSLKRHQHCDIIDINPGAGLWSSKLHDYLRPRSHLLVEPHTDLYRPYLEPLLANPNSTYRLADTTGFKPDRYCTYEKILNESLLQHPKNPVPTDNSLANDSLLFVANMAYYPQMMVQGFGTKAQYMVHHFLNTIRDRSSFHRYGLVRMLIWVLDKEKNPFLPRSVAARMKMAVEADIFSSVEEVAGSESAAGTERRPIDLELESARRVAQSMRDCHVELPRNRQGVLHRAVTRNRKKGSTAELSELDELDSYGGRNWHSELRSLQKEFEEGVFTEYVGETTGSRKDNLVSTEGGPSKPKATRARTPQFQRMRKLTNTLRAQQKEQEKIEELATELAELDTLESRLEEPDLSEDERTLMRKELNDKVTLTQDKVNAGVKGFAHKVTFVADNRSAFQQTPPLLMWDRRSAEPLVVHDEDFYPNHAMALLDIQPKPVETTSFFDFLITSLFRHPTQSVRQTLDSMAPGAADALLPEVPGLRYRVGEVRARTLTTKMLKDLADAWGRWPFRPSMADVMNSTSDMNIGSRSNVDENDIFFK